MGRTFPNCPVGNNNQHAEYQCECSTGTGPESHRCVSAFLVEFCFDKQHWRNLGPLGEEVIWIVLLSSGSVCSWALESHRASVSLSAQWSHSWHPAQGCESQCYNACDYIWEHCSVRWPACAEGVDVRSPGSTRPQMHADCCAATSLRHLGPAAAMPVASTLSIS